MTGVPELLGLIAAGESSRVELKRDDSSPDKVAREMVAFANHEGGTILLGVEDDRTVTGLTRWDVEEWVMNIARESVEPPIVPDFETVPEVAPGRRVAVIRVPRGYTLHALKEGRRRTYLIRVGSTNRVMDREEIARLLSQRGDVRAELRPVPGTAWTDLDVRRLAWHVTRNLRQPLPAADGDWRHLLRLLELLEGEQASLAGLLLFGREPQRRLPQATITAVAYPGLEKGYTATERAVLRGPLLSLPSEAGTTEPGLVEQALGFVARSATLPAQLSGGRRTQSAAYPPDVVRETVVNALVHREYLLAGTDIELSVYADRLEIVSPGSLPNGVTVEGIKVGARAARNQLLKDVMRDFGYVEGSGLGVPRKIIAGMKEHNGTEPDFEDAYQRFTVRLWLGRPANDPPTG